EHAHRMRIVVEAAHESLYVFMDPGVVRDLPCPLLEGLLRRQLAAEQEVGDLEKRRPLRELLDGIASIPEDASVPVDERDGAACRGRVHERGVVGEEPEVIRSALELSKLHRADGPVSDRDVAVLPRTVVGDRQRVLAHRALLSDAALTPRARAARWLAARPARTRPWAC